MALVIYTKPDCPYCDHAVEFYRENNIDFVERDAQNNPEFQREMLEFAGGETTVPCIVENGVHIQSGWGKPLRGCTIYIKT